MTATAINQSESTQKKQNISVPELLKERLGEARLRELVSRVTPGTGPRDKVAGEAPFTAEPIIEIPLCTADDVALAAQKARQAQIAWAATPYRERAKIFLRYHDLVLKKQQECLDVIQLETGKARRHAFEENLDVANVCRHYAHHGQHALSPKRRRGALPLLTATWELHPPLSLIGFIAPWNYPLTLAITDAIPALLAGNGVILKPDQQTPLTALWAVDLLYQAGLPENLFQVVTGRGRDLGTPLIQHVDFICFTGSTATGRIIARQAGERLIGCSLELGGKNPLIILNDADISRAVEGSIRACFFNAGQLCISCERLFVDRGIYEPFVEQFSERVRNLKLGADLDLATEMGSMASKAQFEKTREHVEEAKKRGARILAGGRARPDLGPYFFEPTVMEGVTPEMSVCAEETFGPVVSAYRFDNEDEMVARANDTNYGLNASIWTQDTTRGRALAARIQTGTVNVNEGYVATWASVDSPMGGFKESGLGRRHGNQGILKYTQAQTISVQRFLPIAAPSNVSEAWYERSMTFLVGMLRHVPGIR
jgi:succinate-semialdehyde dehydrogenase / glutarate-semialdehyde dehydrogenase